MNPPGMGVMINMLSGRSQEEVDVYTNSIGKTIKSLQVVEDQELIIMFEDETGIKVWDDGQSCCERRYLSTDEKLENFIGAKLLEIEIADGPGVEESYDCHETQFLRIKTDKDIITFSNHNEHNGYYGGFYVRIVAVTS